MARYRICARITHVNGSGMAAVTVEAYGIVDAINKAIRKLRDQCDYEDLWEAELDIYAAERIKEDK